MIQKVEVGRWGCMWCQYSLIKCSNSLFLRQLCQDRLLFGDLHSEDHFSAQPSDYLWDSTALCWNTVEVAMAPHLNRPDIWGSVCLFFLLSALHRNLLRIIEFLRKFEVKEGLLNSLAGRQTSLKNTYLHAENKLRLYSNHVSVNNIYKSFCLLRPKEILSLKPSNIIFFFT